MDIVLVSVGLVTLVFSLMAFIGITSTLILTARASTVQHYRCILYSSSNDEHTELVFGKSGPCYAVFVAPIGTWFCIIPLILFLVAKIWRKWNLSALAWLWLLVLTALFLYSIATASLVSAGEHRTCSKVSNLTHPLGGMQSCSQGGAYFNVSRGSEGYIRFDDWVDLTEVSMWISTLLIFFMLVIYAMRSFLCVCRMFSK